MSYEYTLTNDSKFYGEQFTENKSEIQLKNDGTVECDELIEQWFTKKLSDNSLWVKIFYQNISKGVFTNLSNILTEDMIYKFSRISELDTLAEKTNDNKYEFLLEFPTQLPGKYNRWKQSSNPFTPTTANSGVTGYESVLIDFDTNYWNGLEYNGGPCLADGSSRGADQGNTVVENSAGHSNWFYAIACRQWHNDGIPGYNNLSYSDIALWVKTTQEKIDNSIYLSNDKKIFCNEFIEE